MREMTTGPAGDAHRAVSYWTRYAENCSEPMFFGSVRTTPATHKSKTLAGAPSDPPLLRTLAPTDQSPEDGQGGVGWVIGRWSQIPHCVPKFRWEQDQTRNWINS